MIQLGLPINKAKNNIASCNYYLQLLYIKGGLRGFLGGGAPLRNDNYI